MKIEEQRITAICLSILTVMACTVALVYLQSVLLPFVIAVFLYMIMSPLIDWIEDKLAINRMISVLIAGLASMVICGLLFLLFFLSIKQFVSGVSEYQAKLLGAVEHARAFLAGFGIPIDQGMVKDSLKDMPVLTTLQTLTGSIVGFVGNSLLVMLYIAFMITGDSYKTPGTMSLYKKVKNQISQYVRAKFIISAGTGILVGTVFLFVGLDLALMFAVLTFLLNFIPSIGSLVAILIPIPVAAMQFGFGPSFFVAIIIPAIIQFVLGNVIEPKMMGESLGLHPIALMLALLFWGIVWGVAGMFLAVPITVMLAIICDTTEFTRPVAKLLAGKF